MKELLKTIPAFCIALCLPLIAQVQQGHAYREYDRGTCIATERAYDRIPDEVYFQVEVSQNNFYAVFNDVQWFDDFFGDDRRNLGIQLVSESFFDCNRVGYEDYDAYFHYLEPLSYREMKQQQHTTAQGLYVVPLGAVPRRFLHQEFDHGIIISRRGRPCIDHWYTRTPVHDWQLLEHALLLDTLVFPSAPPAFATPEDTLTINKVYHHDVLFPKNKTTFNKDSLRRFLYGLPLISHDPCQVTISAYASVEGPKERNTALYKQRARVILDETAPLLPEDVSYELEVAENWDDFYLDISRTPYAYLREEEPAQVRELLNNTPLGEEMEPILQKHRKARVSIHMGMEVLPGKSDTEALTDFFRESLSSEDVENALLIQQVLFSQLTSEELARTFADSLPMPRDKRFSPVFNRNYTYRYLTGITDMRETLHLFDQLLHHYPDDGAIHFNRAEMKFRLWIAGDKAFTSDMVQSAISSLGEYDIPEQAVNRLLTNYSLVSLREAMADGDHRRRVRSVRRIRNLFAGSYASEAEQVNMARFFVAYRQADLAERLLRPFARREHPDEDILFYYLKVTFSENSMLNMRWYHDLLEKARDMNTTRFCNLFKPMYHEGAAGLALLFRDDIRELVCRSCQDVL